MQLIVSNGGKVGACSNVVYHEWFLEVMTDGVMNSIRCGNNPVGSSVPSQVLRQLVVFDFFKNLESLYV